MITIWKTPIVATVEQVLKDLKLQLYGAGLLKEIKNTGSDLMCTCPFHANGKEHNPSCGVLLQQKVTKDKTYEAGTVHCYTCGYTADLPQFVADLLGLSSPVEGFKWLVNQYNYQTEEREIPDLDERCYGEVLGMEEKLDKFLAYLEENGVEISGETAFKCDDGIVLFSPNEGGGVDIAIIRNVIELNYNLGITDADVNLFNTEVGIMQELGGSEDGE